MALSQHHVLFGGVNIAGSFHNVKSLQVVECFPCLDIVGQFMARSFLNALTLFIPDTWQVNIPMLPEHLGENRCYKK